MYELIGWRKIIGPYQENTVAGIYEGIVLLKHASNTNGRPFKQNTMHDYVMILKRFYLLMIENEYLSLPQKKIEKIKPPRMDTMTKKATDLLTRQEIRAMVTA